MKGDTAYGCKCAEMISGGTAKDKSMLLPVATVDISNSPLATDSRDLLDHIKSLGLDDRMNVDVAYSHEPHYFKLNGRTAEATATYNPASGKILFYSGIDAYPPEEIKKVLSHEYGHAVWFQLFSVRKQNDWNKIYSQARSTGRFITDYASNSVEEFFAECLAGYVHDAAILKRVSPKSYVWIKNEIFSGREFN